MSKCIKRKVQVGREVQARRENWKYKWDEEVRKEEGCGCGRGDLNSSGKKRERSL
jgi:hypothetical protein